MEASSSLSTLNPLAEPFRSTRPPTSNPSSASDPATHEQLFHNLFTYPFHQDAEFQSGLSAILGHPETPASPEEVEQNADLVLKAECFYFSRQNNLPSPIDPASYKSWLRVRDQQPSAETPSPSLSDTDNMPSPFPPPPPPPPTQSTTPLPSDPPPPSPKYPTTFTHIVDLITRNQPIPGIETIPDIVLGTELSAPNTVPARKKPWETATATAQPEETPPEGQEASASGRPLFGGLLGPLKKEMGGPSDLKPVPVETMTPSWQELAEGVAAGQAAQGGDTPVAHAT